MYKRQNVEVVRLEEGIRYTPAEHFGRNLYRYLRFHYPTYLFDEPAFEIDEEGRPWWVCPRIDRTIGLFGGTDITGAALVNAVTGETAYYDVADIPTSVSYTHLDVYKRQRGYQAFCTFYSRGDQNHHCSPDRNGHIQSRTGH